MATHNILNTFEKQMSKRVPTDEVGLTEEKTNGGPKSPPRKTPISRKATKRSLNTKRHPT